MGTVVFVPVEEGGSTSKMAGCARYLVAICEHHKRKGVAALGMALSMSQFSLSESTIPCLVSAFCVELPQHIDLDLEQIGS